ncbi:hypothetical protein [uncultured Arsenicicoccus sp.]|uniref:hypothetical protein n=1 Tax=uncultured Arsenicicoccus sp. TaxID=491339 RepID=UPI002599AC17|nr:hypothetical protein [uncultured Arsenicicoccus sp.]
MPVPVIPVIPVIARFLGIPEVPSIPGPLVLLGLALVLLAWRLTYTAARLDRLHARVEGALVAVDAQLVRRAEAVQELAGSGLLDPATSLFLAAAAAESLELEDEPVDARVEAETDLSQALDLALPPETVDGLRRDGDHGGRVLLQRLRSSCTRVQLARRFHNDAVVDVQRVRRKRLVRAFRLAGHAELPRTVEFDDRLPSALE